MSRSSSAVAGAAAAGVSLGATELASGVTRRIPSLVVSMGDVVIDFAPFAVVEGAISLFGQNDKTALVAGTVVLALGFGAWLGLAAERHRWAVAGGFAGFGVLGVLAANRQPDASVVLTGAATAGAALAGVVAFAVLRRAAAPTHATSGEAAPDADDVRAPGRRRFLALAGSGAVLASLTALTGSRLRQRLNVEGARAQIVLPKPRRADPPIGSAALDVDGLSPLVTPNRDFYRIDTAILVPQVEPDGWTLRVTGLVDRPYELTYAELLRLPMTEEWVTLACVSNEVGGDLVGNARWLGVPLKDVLERAGPREGATQVVGRSVDGFTVGFPTAAAYDGRVALLAVGMNGEPLPVVHGFPARLVVSGLYGYVSATKWLSEIELTRYEDFDAYWIPRGWAKEAPVKTQSRIDTPKSGRTVGPGTVPIAGVAWAPGRGISKVEVRIAGGPWREAELSGDTPDDTWRQWVYRWDPEPGTHAVAVRATDGSGETQTADRSPPAPDGATGYHTIVLRA